MWSCANPKHLAEYIRVGLICLILGLAACSDSSKVATEVEMLPPHLGRYMGAVRFGNYGSALIVVSNIGGEAGITEYRFEIPVHGGEATFWGTNMSSGFATIKNDRFSFTQGSFSLSGVFEGIYNADPKIPKVSGTFNTGSDIGDWAAGGPRTP